MSPEWEWELFGPRIISWTHYRVSGSEFLNKPVPEGEEMSSELQLSAVFLLGDLGHSEEGH